MTTHLYLEIFGKFQIYNNLTPRLTPLNGHTELPQLFLSYYLRYGYFELSSCYYSLNMLWDSNIWKNELKKEVRRFKKIMVFRDEISVHSENYYWLRIERFFFVSFFIIRKLIEAKKLSDELERKKYKISLYQRISAMNKIDILNNHDFDRFYDLNNSKENEVIMATLCNFFIHSFVFQPTFLENKSKTIMTIIGVFVNSDWTKEKNLFHISIDCLFDIFDDVIKDDVVSLHLNRRKGTLNKSSRHVGKENDVGESWL